jgi:hypothetical protein
MNDPQLRPNMPPVIAATHDVRKEARRRLMIGLSGIVIVMLVVVLAGLLAGQARQEAELAKAQAEAAGVVNPGTEPTQIGEPAISDVGVATPTTTSTGGNAVIAPAPANGSVVPDLQPDPQLDPLKNN